jgi:putative salt-induced outer membrane protein YdiY
LLGLVTAGVASAQNPAMMQAPSPDWQLLPPVIELPPEFRTAPELPPAYDSMPALQPADPPVQVAPTEAAPAIDHVPTPGPLPADATPPMPVEATEELVVDPESWWIRPYHWVKSAEWEGGLEVGINGASGNAETFTMRTGANLKRKTKVYEFKWDVTYLKTTSDGVESQHRMLGNARYERFFGETRWMYFIKSFVEYDEFKAFDMRIVLNAGGGYRIIRSDHMNLKARFGTGFSHEIGGPDDDVEPEAVFGGDYEWKLTDKQKLNATMDYMPAWSDFRDYQLITEANWEVLLDWPADLSLKLSVSDRYDSTPNGRRPNDLDYGLLLLWKI